MNISRPQLNTITEIIEDTVEYLCDQETLSGELLWTVIGCLSEAKLAELKCELSTAQ